MKIAILGFGIEGRDAARYFINKDADISIYDKKPKEDLDFTGFEQGLTFNKFKWFTGENYLEKGLLGFDFIVRSPGIRPDLPQILDALKQGTVLTSVTQIFLDEVKVPVIAVTGTKGKGTTSTMIARGLEAAGKKVFLAGNIGEPMLVGIDLANESDYAVLELSSFQTMDLSKSPHVVVVTNITSDHMDWHKDQDEYESAKANLWKNQTSDDFVIVNEDDPTSIKISTNTTGKVISYNGENDKANELKVPGKHNIYNANAAMCAIKALGEDSEKSWLGITAFEGLEHRLEKVAEINGVTYINDSYATNPEPTKAALLSFPGPKILIAGGSEKNADFTELGINIAKMNIKALLLIGVTASRIEESALKAEYAGILEKDFSDMPSVVGRAYKLAVDGDVVLLSPACASFGMFDNYKDRGKKFKQAVKNLNDHGSS